MADGSEVRVRQRFTGYEKDDETQLDFAEARMYQNRHGRFTAPDPLLASASAANPQTFNRYIYTGNNPVNITDPSGLNWCRNDETAVTSWTGGAACGTGFTNMTGRTGTNIGDSCYTQANGSCRYYERNSSVRFNSNGTTSGRDLPTISENPEVEVTDTASQEIASAGASELGTSMNQRPLAAIPLTCPVSVTSCGGDTPLYSNPLTGNGATFEEVTQFVDDASTTLGFIPGFGEPFDAVAALNSLIRGDREGFALSVGALNPLGGQVFGGIKLARRVGNLERGADVARDGLTNAQLIQKSATIAERAIGGSGPVSGIAKHQRATALLNRYQSIYGNRGISTNVYFNNGNGNRGFLDVLDRTNGTIYDFKFGKAKMSRAQYNKYSRNFGLPIEIIRP